MRLGMLRGTSSLILLRFKFKVRSVFHPSSILRALKSFTLFFSAFKLTRLGSADTI